MLLFAAAAALWGWWIQPSPFLHGKAPLPHATLAYDKDELILALSGNRQAQTQFLMWRQKEGALVNFAPLLEQPSTQEKLPKIFTQSYAAASLALALCEEGQILAVPSQLHSQTKWHNLNVLKSVPYKTEDVDAELLYQIRPDRCIASHFSSPYSIDRFQRQGLLTLILPAPNQIQAIEASIEKTASFVQRPQEGKWLLETFRQSLSWLHSQLPSGEIDEEKILIIELHRQMSLPSHKQLYMKWLYPNHQSENDFTSWSQPIDYETLYTLNPKLAILICDDLEETAKELSQDPKWQRLLSQTNLRYTLVSTQCLCSPSQIFAIGLYDLVAAIKGLSEPSLLVKDTL